MRIDEFEFRNEKGQEIEPTKAMLVCYIKSLHKDIKLLEKKLDLESKVKCSVPDFLKKRDRKIVEKVLFDVLFSLYFQDYNRACDYDKMSGKEVVDAQHKVLKEIEERYNYNFRFDILP